MSRLKNLIIDSASPIAGTTTTVAVIALTQKLTQTSLGLTYNIVDSAKLIAITSIVIILAEKYDFY